MFGYVTVSLPELTEERQKRYRAFYCGLCRTLKERHGEVGRVTLSNDMTFLYLLLSSLYEPEETPGSGRCLPHPVRERGYVQNAAAEYCADMNIALAYHKCLDDWKDDHSAVSKAQAKLLRSAYEKVETLHPPQCKVIEECLREIGKMEENRCSCPDEPANATAQMLAMIFRYREDIWTEALTQMGESLGRFIYLMDAYEDLPADMRRKRYNPLESYAEKADYEEFCKESLMLMMGECTQAFETLPLVQDVDILRNILYSGVWTRYQLIRQRREKPQKLLPKEDGR